MDKQQTYKNILHGTLWAMTLRWSVKIIGLVSTIILARLLSPNDFGMVAIATVTAAFIQQFINLGIGNLLIREEKIDTDFCNTAWTLQVLQGVFLALLLYGFATPAAIHFNQPEAITIIHMYCISSIIGGFSNIGLVLFRRDLQFSSDFKYGFYIRMIKFVIVISLAFLLKNYWALVFGQILTSVAQVILSYKMHSFRPKFSLLHAKVFLKFARSIIPLSIATFLNKKLDVILVGGVTNTATLGAYTVAGSLGSMLTHELVLPLGRGLLPSLSKVKTQPKLLKDAYSDTIGLTVLLLLPAGLGLSALSEYLVPILLGQQWNEAIPILAWLSIYGAIAGVLHTLGGQVQIITGHEHIAALLSWLRAILLLICASVFSLYWGAEGAAAGALLSSIIALPIVASQLKASVGITVFDLLKTVWRPALASFIMYIILILIKNQFSYYNLHAVTLLTFISGCLAYGISLFLLWYITGKPICVEKRLCYKIIKALK